MTEPGWSAHVRARVAGHAVVLVGIGPAQLLGVAAAGARVVGVISVVPAGGPPVPTDADVGMPLLTIEGTSRDILDHVVHRYAEALSTHAPRVGAFLDRVDPAGRAAVVSYLPLPHHVLGGRACWTADANVSGALEAKVPGGGLLADVVPVIVSRPCPPGPAAEWWSAMCAGSGADRLVVQTGGLSGGGTGTYVCASPTDVPVVGDGAIVLPFVEGRSGNVMGVVDERGTTVVLPASRQLLRIDQGRPLYAGNVTGEPWTRDDRPAIERDVRAIGTALASAGFFGPFGVDFIDGPAGRRYHDLNPRMNGVADSLARLVASEDRVPLVAALLSRPAWAPADVRAIEDELHDAAARRPLARLWLTRTVERAMTIEPPMSGAWRISPSGPSVTFVGGDEIGGDRAVLQPLVPPGLRVRPGDRLALGNLYGDPELVIALGDGAGPALVDAFLA